MTDILTVDAASRELGEVLRTSLDPLERLEAAQVLSCYDGGGEQIYTLLLFALQDPAEPVRVQAYYGFGRMRFWNTKDLLELARGIRHALELEEPDTLAFNAGMKTLDSLRDYYEESLIKDMDISKSPDHSYFYNSK